MQQLEKTAKILDMLHAGKEYTKQFFSKGYTFGLFHSILFNRPFSGFFHGWAGYLITEPLGNNCCPVTAS